MVLTKTEQRKLRSFQVRAKKVAKESTKQEEMEGCVSPPSVEGTLFTTGRLD